MHIIKGWTKQKTCSCSKCKIKGKPYDVNNPKDNYVKYMDTGRHYCTKCAKEIMEHETKLSNYEPREWEYMHHFY